MTVFKIIAYLTFALLFAGKSINVAFAQAVTLEGKLPHSHRRVPAVNRRPTGWGPLIRSHTNSLTYLCPFSFVGIDFYLTCFFV